MAGISSVKSHVAARAAPSPCTGRPPCPQSGSEIAHGPALGRESVLARCENRVHRRAIAHGCGHGDHWELAWLLVYR
jgi:hypothetical protein